MAEKVVTRNIRERHFYDVLNGILSDIDKEKKQKSLKIKFVGQNTNYSVYVSNNFLKDDEKKEKMIAAAKKKLDREIKFGTRHIYIGDKLM